MTALRRTHPVAQVLVDDPVCTVVAHVPAGRAVVLQGASEVIWHRLPAAEDPAREASRLAAELAQETGVDVVVLEQQVLDMAADLAEQGLVELL